MDFWMLDVGNLRLLQAILTLTCMYVLYVLSVLCFVQRADDPCYLLGWVFKISSSLHHNTAAANK